VYETGAVLLVLADRFPVLGPRVGTPERADLYRWILWLADTLHPAWWPLMKTPSGDPEPEAEAAARARGRESMDAHGSYLERELARGPWCLGETFSVAELYLYMLVGWENYIRGGYQVGGERVRAHYARRGAARGRALARARRPRRAAAAAPPGAAGEEDHHPDKSQRWRRPSAGEAIEQRDNLDLGRGNAAGSARRRRHERTSR
jgi:glutathione S-transferase